MHPVLKVLKPTMLTFVVMGVLLLLTLVTSLGFMGEAMCLVEGPCPTSFYQRNPSLVLPFRILTWPYAIADTLERNFETAFYHQLQLRDNWSLVKAIRNIAVVIGILLILLYQYLLSCLLLIHYKTRNIVS